MLAQLSDKVDMMDKATVDRLGVCVLHNLHSLACVLCCVGREL